ncbi:MAG: sugar phosphate isomerase/epimerase [Acidobacteria bacterium]|nr:sugar phosphate isomerase/epimerase [Acidobacteriota bacterium]
MISRREFVKNAAAGTLTASAMGAAGERIAAVTPIDDQGKSSEARLMPGCCAYSYNEELRRGAMTLEDFILKAVELRVLAVDITAYYLKSSEPGYLHGLRKLAYRHGVSFSGAACGVSMVQADSAKRAESLTELKKWIDVTDALGTSHLRIFAGKLPAGADAKEAINWVVETMKAACDYSGAKGITLGLEDHDGVTQSADACLEVMQRVNSPFAGINLDITNFIATPAQDAYAQIAACLPYATHTHIRDHFPDGTPVDMNRVWQMFARAGHQGYMSAEYEGDSAGHFPAATGVPKLVSQIRELCSRYSTV